MAVSAVQKPERKLAVNLTGHEWSARHISRERYKVIGLLIVALFILALAFVRFGRTIPWAAR